MTARMLINALLNYPNLDAQVVDSDGSPIMYTLYHSPRENDSIRLEPKSQMDIKEGLDSFRDEMIDTGMSDDDVIQELKDRGYTLEDFKEYDKTLYLFAKDKW